MKNKIRSRAYFKIKRAINSCETAEQLDTTLTMIAAHLDLDEVFDLHQVHKAKVKALQSVETFGEKFERSAQNEIFENPIETEIHKKFLRI